MCYIYVVHNAGKRSVVCKECRGQVHVMDLLQGPGVIVMYSSVNAVKVSSM